MNEKLDFPKYTHKDERVLVVGKRAGILRWPEHVYEACERLGVRCQFFATNHQNEVDRIVNRFKKTIRRDWAENHLARKFRRVMESFSPTVVIFTDIFSPSATWSEALIEFKSSYYGVAWVGDNFHGAMISNNRFIDRFYFTDTQLVKKAQDLGLNDPQYLPLAVNETIFKKSILWKERNDSILFIGAFSENRYDILKKIKLPVEVYGRGWNVIMPSHHKVYPDNISLEQVARLYSSHKYVLNIINSENIISGTNMRCYEATAAGALLITQKVADLAMSFAPNEVATWEIVESHDSVKFSFDISLDCAEQVAEAGRARTLLNHSYVNRVEVLLQR